MKYDFHPSIGVWLGQIAAKAIFEDEFKNDFSILAPVPLHRKRYKERGFNQAEMIAKGGASKIPFFEVKKCLTRTKNTENQAKLKKQERIENVKSAFIVPKKFEQTVTGKAIVLVDDVLTTGSTMAECAKALFAAGAQKVAGFTIARTGKDFAV